MRYFLRRILNGFFLLFGVSVLSFLLSELAPGDYLAEMRLDPTVSEETLAAVRSRLGIDRPLPARYLRWLASVAGGDFGFSFSHNSPVAPLLLDRAANTLLLSAAGTLLAWALALPLGIWLAQRRGRWLEAISGGASSLLLATPDLVLALALLLVAVRTGWLPTGGMVSPGAAELDAFARLGDRLRHLLLPVTVLVLGLLPALLRHVQASMSEVLESPFLRAVRGFGIPRRRLLFRHALPVAANPLISLFGLSVAGLLSSSLLVEVVMSWPGIGPFLLEAILARDVYVVIGVVMASTLFLLLGNLLADLLLYAVDPRIRARGS